jgi:hypothetical protein
MLLGYGKHGPSLNDEVTGRIDDERGCLDQMASLRFPSPLIKPAMRVSRIQLSDRFHCRTTAIIQRQKSEVSIEHMYHWYSLEIDSAMAP